MLIELQRQKFKLQTEKMFKEDDYKLEQPGLLDKSVDDETYQKYEHEHERKSIFQGFKTETEVKNEELKAIKISSGSKQKKVVKKSPSKKPIDKSI